MAQYANSCIGCYGSTAWAWHSSSFIRADTFQRKGLGLGPDDIWTAVHNARRSSGLDDTMLSTSWHPIYPLTGELNLKEIFSICELFSVSLRAISCPWALGALSSLPLQSSLKYPISHPQNLWKFTCQPVRHSFQIARGGYN